jgi:hypothetical protein
MLMITEMTGGYGLLVPLMLLLRDRRDARAQAREYLRRAGRRQPELARTSAAT